MDNIEKKWFKVNEIAKIRKVTVQAVYQQIKTHKYELEGHTKTDGRATLYDNYVVDLFDEASEKAPVNEVWTADRVEIEELRKKNAELEAQHQADHEAFRKMADTLAEFIQELKDTKAIADKSQYYIGENERLEDTIHKQDEYIRWLKNRPLVSRILNSDLTPVQIMELDFEIYKMEEKNSGNPDYKDN